MKLNQWTLGLAAVGAVSLASAVQADEAKVSQVQTALSSTTLSGYVDVSAQYAPGNKNAGSVVTFPSTGSGVKDGFMLDNATISLDKPQDESPWAAGYHVDLNAGANALNFLPGATTANVGIRQAYVVLRTPIGNGIDWKVGGIDGVTGYEVNTGYQNPNYTRSIGYSVNPASLVGILGTYSFNKSIAVTAGVANRGGSFTSSPYSLGQSAVGLASKDYIFDLALTAPDSWGFLKGSTLNAGTFQGFDNGAVNNYSVNGTINTPLTGLSVGLAWDAVQSLVSHENGNIFGAYIIYKANDKLSFTLRGESYDANDALLKAGFYGGNGKGEELTLTTEYDLWANVTSRVEFRWDHAETGRPFTSATVPLKDSFLLALNLVYKF